MREKPVPNLDGKALCRVASYRSRLYVYAGALPWLPVIRRAKLAARSVVFILLLSGAFKLAISQTLLSPSPTPELMEVLGDPNMPLLANALVSVCKSDESDWQAFCESYIESTMHLWKMGVACASARPQDQSYCAGANAAEDKMNKLKEACKDCRIDMPVPKDHGDAEQMKAFNERFNLVKKRMRSFVVEMETALGVCVPDKQHDEIYCKGYNTWAAIMISHDTSTFRRESASIRDLGRDNAAGDLFVHVFVGEGFYHIVPCVPVQTSQQDARDTMLEFVRDHPEHQQHDTTAVMLLAKALYYRICPGPAKRLQPHMEHCTTWSYDSGQLGTVNTCERAVTIQFLAPEQPVIERKLDPGEAYSTGKTRKEMGEDWWFTTCPAGLVSSVAVSTDNSELLFASLYSCVKK